MKNWLESTKTNAIICIKWNNDKLKKKPLVVAIQVSLKESINIEDKAKTIVQGHVPWTSAGRCNINLQEETE